MNAVRYLSRAWRRRSSEFEERGFCVLRNILPNAAVSNVHAAIRDEIFTCEKALLRHPSGQREQNVWAERLDGTRFVANSLMNPHLQKDCRRTGSAIIDLLGGEALADRLSAIDGNHSYLLWQTILFFRSPGTGIHVDGWGTDTVPSGGQFTLWIPLEDVSPENGPIGVFPWRPAAGVSLAAAGLADCAEESRAVFETYQGEITRQVLDRRLDCIVPIVRARDVIVFSSVTPHVSMPPRHDRMSRFAIQAIVVPAAAELGCGMVERSRGGRVVHSKDNMMPINDRWAVSLLAEH
jgi:ectoine hydroxylase-related dioxygenase (phytanoyl-CoA dioxygenase family)